MRGRTARASATSDQKGIVEVTSAQHHDELTKHEHVIVLYYAPWCVHCQSMKPAYKAAAEAHSEALYIMVDCENAVDSSFVQAHGIQGFPTMRCYSDGRVLSEYEGERTADSIVAWAKQQKRSN